VIEGYKLLRARAVLLPFENTAVTGMLFLCDHQTSIEEQAMLLAEKSVSNFELPSSMMAAAKPATHLEMLFGKQPIECFHPGQTVFFEGDPAKHVFEIVDGVLRLFKILADGRRVVTGFLFPGDVVGVSQKHRFMYGSEAVSEARLRRISRRSLDEAVDRSSELRPQVFAALCDEMAAAHEQMVLLSCKSAEERVCSFLVLLLKRNGDFGAMPSFVDLPMSRLDVADYLGLTIETVSRNLTRLANKGVLSHVERFSLRVVKPRALEQLAGLWEDEDYEPLATSSRYRH
jgi:CRP/FNR family transcriptional regulator